MRVFRKRPPETLVILVVTPFRDRAIEVYPQHRPGEPSWARNASRPLGIPDVATGRSQMKSGKLLHGELSATIARMGHGDGLVIGDAGLPIPHGPLRIDLALARAIPPFLATLETVLDELRVERIVLADEIKLRNPTQLAGIEQLLSGYHGRTAVRVEVNFVSHDELKRRTGTAIAVVRTGECTPYSNVILHSGVVF
jgi:D-ribose pyranase